MYPFRRVFALVAIGFIAAPVSTVGSRCKWEPAPTRQEATVGLDGFDWTVPPLTVGPDGSNSTDFARQGRLTTNSGQGLEDCALSWAETPVRALLLTMRVGDMDKCAPGGVVYAEVDTASAYEECQKGVSVARPLGFAIRTTTICAKIVLQDGAMLVAETWVTRQVGCGPCMLKNGFIKATLTSPDNVVEGQTMTLTMRMANTDRC